jgi:hypothetical protein
MWDPESADLDVVLRSAAAAPPDPATEERVFAEAWSRVQSSIRDGARTADETLEVRRLDLIADRDLAARRRRRGARLASITLAVAVAGAGTAAATEFISTRTGQHTSGWEVGAAGPGEFLNLGGTDRDQVFEQVVDGIPFPAGYEAQRSWALNFYPRETDSAVTDSRLRALVAGNAVCTWADAWIAADDAGNAAARDAATTTLVAAVSWEDIRADDIPDAVPIQGTDQRRSYWGWLPPLAQAAEAGDHQAVLDAVAGSYFCSYHVLPVIDADPGYAYAGLR